jgi:hypothetical protein
MGVSRQAVVGEITGGKYRPAGGYKRFHRSAKVFPSVSAESEYASARNAQYSGSQKQFRAIFAQIFTVFL